MPASLAYLCFFTCALVASASAYQPVACHSNVNEYACEHDTASCFWCTLNQGTSYTCYTAAEAAILSGASCSKPVPTKPTPPPAPSAPTPPQPPKPTPPPGPCFDYSVKSGDDCYDLEVYYGTKNITTLAHATCEAAQLQIGETLRVCGCTEHCSDHPQPHSGSCVNHTIAQGEDCVDLAKYFGSDIADMRCMSRIFNGTKGACPPGPYCGVVPLWVGDVVEVCNCHSHCNETVPPTPAPAPTPVSSICLNHTVVVGDNCIDLATYFGSELEYIKCESRLQKDGAPTACPLSFSCSNKSADELFVGDKLQVCDCHKHCNETSPPTPAPPAPPAPAPKDCSKTGSETKCPVLDPKAYCGISPNKAAVWNDGTGCSCDWGYSFDAQTHHCTNKTDYYYE